jgi:F-type H+-transporting ATPase subunit a
MNQVALAARGQTRQPPALPTPVRGFLAAVILTLLAGISLAAGRTWAGEDKTHSEKHTPAKTDQAASTAHGHKKPNAMAHVVDSTDWHFFETFGRPWDLPEVFGLQITKFMLLELVAAGLILLIFVPLARRLQSGQPATGWWDNTFEVLLTFIRNEVAKPAIGEHDADKFVPFLWTLFLFILFNNLLGMFPFFGSATASISVTGALALVVFFAIHGSAIAKMGFGHYVQTLWPHIDVPFGLGYVLKPLIFVLELIGVLVRNAVLAVRLFANMLAGHILLAMILIFIVVATDAGPLLWSTITVSSLAGVIAISFLEIFVAFLQAYIFVFLTAIFMGMAMHPEH